MRWCCRDIQRAISSVAPCRVSQLSDAADIEAAVARAASPTNGWGGVSGAHARPPHEWDSMQTLLWLDSLEPSIKHDPKAVVADALVAGGVNGSLLLAMARGAAAAPPLTAVGVRKGAEAGRLRRLLGELAAERS